MSLQHDRRKQFVSKSSIVAVKPSGSLERQIFNQHGV
jgi:hypothetical protein